MKDGYAYCLANEREIREHIAFSEKQGHEQVDEVLKQNRAEFKESVEYFVD